MTILAIHRLPKPILGRSMPLRSMVQVNLDDGVLPDIAFLLHRWDEPDDEPIRVPLHQSSYRGDRYLLDLRAYELVADGCYEGEIAVADERRGLDVNLWVMDDEAYDEFRRKIAAEPFLPSRGLDAEAAREFVDRIMDAALAEDRFDLDPAFISEGLFYADGSRDRLYPAGAMRWIAEHLAMELRYLAVTGARGISWQTRLAGDAFGMHAQINLEPAVAEWVGSGTLEATLRDLQHLEEQWSGKPVRTSADMLSGDRVAIEIELALTGIPMME